MGIVYVLTNPTMEGLVKIGRTGGDLEARVKALSRAVGVPLPFKVEGARRVKDAVEVERGLHTAFDGQRINPRKEFFRVDPTQAIAALELADGKDETPSHTPVEDEDERKSLANELEREERQQKRQEQLSPFTFSSVKLKPGAVLHCVWDKRIKAKVVDDRKVTYKGQKMSLSAAARKVRGDKWKEYRGPAHWEYRGETLLARRNRLEGR